MSRRFACAALLMIVCVASPWSMYLSAAPTARPELPRVLIDTDMPSSQGRTISVRKGGSLQSALDGAKPGDTIELEAGATFSGQFVLRKKTGDGWIIIRTSAFSQLPSAGNRVKPEHGAVMAKLTPGVPFEPVIVTEPGAHHYRLVGIEISAVPGSDKVNNGLILLDGGRYEGRTYVYQTTAEQVPHHIIIDRCYIHGTPTGQNVRGVLLNSAHTAIVDSYISDFHTTGSDSQAVVGWNGPGPFKLVNNYLEAAGENVMFGGAAASIPGLVPSDIEMRRNHFRKPRSWFPQDPSFAGTRWVVKNHLECKNGQRWLIEGNLFEDHWAGAQSGWFFMLTPRTESGYNLWAVCSDMTFQYNWVRRTTAGIALSGVDTEGQPKTARIAIQHNVFEGIGTYVVSGAYNGWFLMPTNGVQDVLVEHNTVFSTGQAVYFTGLWPGPQRGFVFRNNIMSAVGSGIRGDGGGLTEYAPDASITNNLVVNEPGPVIWPATNNFLVGSVDAAGFVDRPGGNYRLRSTSRYSKAGTEQRALGADIDAVLRAMALNGSQRP